MAFTCESISKGQKNHNMILGEDQGISTFFIWATPWHYESRQNCWRTTVWKACQQGHQTQANSINILGKDSPRGLESIRRTLQVVLQKAAWLQLGLLGPVEQQQPDPVWLWAGPLISATHPSTPNSIITVRGDTTIYQPGLHRWKRNSTIATLALPVKALQTCGSLIILNQTVDSNGKLTAV